MIGAIAFQEVKAYLGNKIKVVTDGYGEDKLNVEGYVRFNKLFLKTTDPQLKIEFFQQKNQIISRINLALEKVGYTTRIVDIITK